MNTTETTTLGELAATYPQASRIFYRKRLDYCCGGKRTLGDACRELDLDPAAVLAEITAPAGDGGLAAWTTRPLNDLIDFIISRYHDKLRVELPELVAMAAKVEQSHAEKASCPRGLAAHLGQVHEAVLSHLAKEEQVLFPMIRAGQGRRTGEPVQAMEQEHRDHAVNLQRTRDLAHDLTPPAEACGTWQALYLRLDELEAELMEHIHLENNVLFPRALRGA